MPIHHHGRSRNAKRAAISAVKNEEKRIKEIMNCIN